VQADQRYVPAAGRAVLTRLYDPVMALTMRERAFRSALVSALLAHPRPSVVLDVGCGTGTLALQLAEQAPTVQVVGIDGDDRILALGRAKVARFGERVRLLRGIAGDLPLADASVDAVVASLLLHHLSPGAKVAALDEFSRVLAPGGRLVIADWGRPHDRMMRATFFLLQLLDGFQNTRDHVSGAIPSLVAEAGFGDVTVSQRWRTTWGSLELLTAERDGKQR
jgi:ubiquinone/menaquinone biosynthesis C-methylase UbiE